MHHYLKQAIQKKKLDIDHLVDTGKHKDTNAGKDNRLPQKTKQEEFFDEGRNSTLYYLAPKTNEIFLYDQKTEKFLQKARDLSQVGLNSNGAPGTTLIGQKIPTYYSTIQRVENDAIYMIGGVGPLVQPDDYNLLSTCLQIDSNFQVTEKKPMKFGRASASLGLVRDRFIIVMGGIIGKNKTTALCTAFDIDTNAWFDIAQLSSPRVNCSAVVLNQRYIYLMPGANASAMKGGNTITIEYMDTGNMVDLIGPQPVTVSTSINGPPTQTSMRVKPVD